MDIGKVVAVFSALGAQSMSVMILLMFQTGIFVHGMATSSEGKLKIQN